ncbi:glycoside hydrolase, partial [Candidatus Bathyarchaeota archaeon]|nr:glycoside hydrolase [Candidatus Bathyarchaeota archaeon]
MRWWWFSTASKEEIRREMSEMASKGVGGVEIQPIYTALEGFAIDGWENIEWLSPEWIDMVECAVEEGKKQGMQVDLTFGSGWPFGGPYIDEKHSSTRLVGFR